MRLMVAAIAPLLVGAAADDDNFDRAARAMTAGASASASGDRAQLRAAALALQVSGARPVAGPDLAEQWLHAAQVDAPLVERDRALGPGYRALRLGGGNTATFEQTFLAGQRARIAVVPLRRSTFAMRVREDATTPVCNASPPHPRCDWVPVYTTRFTIEIRNPGRQAGQYVVMMQ